MKYVAHIAKDEEGRWREPHGLMEHLCGVAERAVEYANVFGAADWARPAALLHDLGKYQPAWQQYLMRTSGYDAENAHIEGGGNHQKQSKARTGRP